MRLIRSILSSSFSSPDLLVLTIRYGALAGWDDHRLEPGIELAEDTVKDFCDLGNMLIVSVRV